jgi:hypothetical protein
MGQAVRSADERSPGRSTEQVAGRYALLDTLGRGGMGVVYRARDESTGRIVAFKQLLSSNAQGRRAAIEALFEREYHTLIRIKHARIIEVYDYGVTEAGPYYTMELLDGEDLAQLAPMPYREACGHLRDVASSLALIHAHRLVHRDVTARNVRLTSDGRAKLIDFGALAGFGQSTTVVGTPVSVAPEALNQLPLDQRTDLFGLGALAYFVLTKRHAYPARGIPELPAVWQRTPLPPSTYAPDVPPALDALVLSLLALDPIARPSNAAVVIDELTAIGKLPPEEADQTCEHYLLSGRMVGRHDEMQWLGRRVARALEGKGTEALIGGGAGVGKTRLLHEIGLEAQIKGLLVLKADGQANPETFGVASTLALALLNAGANEVLPQSAHTALLGHLSSALHERLGRPELAALPEDLGERRARFQTALHEWFIDVASRRGLLVAVDNLQAADENSVAFLAALGRKSRQRGLFVLATQRSGDPIVARAPFSDFKRRGGYLKLAGLAADACEELVRSLFGEVANTGRVANLLFERSAGNPQILMDLAQHLVRTQVVKYVGGTWVLPLGVSPEELPSHLEDLIAARLDVLSARARELAEALSIHKGPISIEQCLATSDRGRDDETYAALDELVAEQILVTDGASYRFAQHAVREAVLHGMDSAARRAHHRRVAETLLASADTDNVRLEAGWHFLGAGEEARGVELLAQAGRQFVLDGKFEQDGQNLVRAFDTTLAVYDRQGRSFHDRTAILFCLVGVAYFTDWQMTLRYGERAIVDGLKITGLELAARLRRFLGRHLALIVALIVAAVRLRRESRRGLEWDIQEAIGGYCAIVPAIVGTNNICYNIEEVERLAEVASPLRMFGKEHVACLMHDFAVAQLYMGQSREHEALGILERLASKFQEPKVIKVIGESSRHRALLGGVLFSKGILHAYEVGTKALDTAKQLEDVTMNVYAMAADQVRLLHHALRGETDEVQRYRDRVEFFAVQGNATWQAENFWPVLLLAAETLCGDTIAVRRIAEQLERRAKELPSMAIYAEAARAAYLSLRGDLSGAIALYESVLPGIAVRRRVAWLSIRAGYADTLSRAGEHARAKDVLEQALSTTLPGEDRIVSRFLEPQRQLALAEAGLGNHTRAVELLDALLARWGDADQPLLVGLLHKARAEVALAMRDAVAFDEHHAAMSRCFKSTRNPALVAQCERLREQDVRNAAHEAAASAAPEVATFHFGDDALGTRRLSQLSAAPNPYELALAMIMEQSKAKVGYLYLLEGDKISLKAATAPHEPPLAVEAELRQAILRADLQLEDSDETAIVPADSRTALHETTAFVESHRPPPPTQSHQHFLLVATRGGVQRVIGGVILEAGPDFVPVDLGHLRPIATVLAERQTRTAGSAELALMGS